MSISKNCKQIFFAFLLSGSIGFISCNSSETDMDTDADNLVENTLDANDDSSRLEMSEVDAVATLSGTYPDTSVTGTANFTDNDGKVKMVLTITVPSKANQSVAVHLHEHGDCGDMGKNSHGHWNPTNQKHGKWGSESFHSGDIGNVELDGTGKGSIEIETNLWTLGGDSTTNILGKAVIVHGGVDDYVSQPSGDAGARIGCGVITKK